MRVNKEDTKEFNGDIDNDSYVFESDLPVKEKKSFVSILTKCLFGLIGLAVLLIIVIAIFF